MTNFDPMMTAYKDAEKHHLEVREQYRQTAARLDMLIEQANEHARRARAAKVEAKTPLLDSQSVVYAAYAALEARNGPSEEDVRREKENKDAWLENNKTEIRKYLGDGR